MAGVPNTHILSVLVQNKPGVLARISSLIARRGFNIESLAVGPTESPEMSRITLQVNVEDIILEQIIKQLNKLIEVLKIVELEDSAIRRELVLVKVKATAETRGQLIEIIGLFGAKAVDLTADVITVEATGSPAKLAALLHRPAIRRARPMCPPIRSASTTRRRLPKRLPCPATPAVKARKTGAGPSRAA